MYLDDREMSDMWNACMLMSKIDDLQDYLNFARKHCKKLIKLSFVDLTVFSAWLFPTARKKSWRFLLLHLIWYPCRVREVMLKRIQLSNRCIDIVAFKCYILYDSDIPYLSHFYYHCWCRNESDHLCIFSDDKRGDLSQIGFLGSPSPSAI